MKIFFLIVACCCSAIAVNGQTDSAAMMAKLFADSTALGTPDGQLTSKQIGATGGKIISDDGRIELIFPPGALTTNTTISIQPTSNTLANGSGKSYWFEPSGTQFKKPVEFVFHYTDEEADACPPDLMGIGMQDQKGNWSFFKYEAWDSVAKIRKGHIRHFSGVSNVYIMSLYISKEKLAVNDSLFALFYDVTNNFRERPDVALHTKHWVIIWYVNGVKNGNDKEGLITWKHSIPSENLASIDYKAPSVLPPQDPVEIMAKVFELSDENRVITMRFKVTIYDAYKVLLVHEFTGRVGMGSKLIDSASFLVWVYPDKFRISDIRNYAPIVIKQGKKAGIQEKFFVGEDAMGTIHITNRMINDSLSHDYPPEVYFEFSPYEVFLYRFQYTSRAGSSDIEPLFDNSIPDEINFIANGKEQHYNITASKAKYKLIVTPARK